MRIYIFVLLLVISTISSAQEFDRFKWSGFISQSVVKTSDGIKLSGNSDNKYGSIMRQEIGGSISYEINENIDFRGMASIIRDSSTDTNPKINYGLIDIHQDKGLYGLRLGRYSYDYGFYNAARNNPLYRDMELPPQGLYRDGFRYMTRSGDGIQFYGKKHLTDNYSVEFDVGVGKPVIYPQKDIVQTFVFSNDAGKFSNSSRVNSVNFNIQNREHGWELKYGYLLMDYKFSTPLIDDGKEFPMKLNNHYIGFRKYFDFGDVTLEYMRSKMGETKWDSLTPLPNYIWGGVEGRNITYKHYLTEKTSLLIGYDTWYVNRADRTGEKMEDATMGMTPNGAMYHKSTNLGVSHREKDYTLKAEYHMVRGTNTIRAEGNNILSQEQPEKYNIFILTATYHLK